jgi:hypothetical protein
MSVTINALVLSCAIDEEKSISRCLSCRSECIGENALTEIRHLQMGQTWGSHGKKL